MKRCIALFVALVLCLSFSATALSTGTPAFTVLFNGMLDTGNTFSNQSTLVLDWQIIANRSGLTLRNTQGLRLAYDNTILQLVKWDGSDAIADSEISTAFSAIYQAGHIGVYNTALRVSAAKSVPDDKRYLNISLGSNVESYTCLQGIPVSLAQVRFAFRPNKSVADLSENSIRCMTVSELSATAQSSAVLLNTTENNITSYEYLRQENGIAIGGDMIDMPTLNYPRGSFNNDGLISDPPVIIIPPSNATESETPSETIESNIIPSIAEPVLSSEYTNPYTDVSSYDWFYNSVKYVTERDIMNGTGDSRFSPSISMSRSMFATALHRLAGLPMATKSVIFSDVADGQWYTNAVQWASENGIILGYNGGKFGKNDSITREQAVTMLYRYSEVMGLDISSREDLSKYKDASQISDWALNAMRWAVNAGIVSGRSPTTLVPQGQMTRAEVAQILLNLN